MQLILAVTEWLRLRRLRSRLDTTATDSSSTPTPRSSPLLQPLGCGHRHPQRRRPGGVRSPPNLRKTHRAVIRFAEQCVEHGIETTLTAVDYAGADLRLRSHRREVGGLSHPPLVPPPGETAADRGDATTSDGAVSSKGAGDNPELPIRR